ncbi:MAG TPA: LysR family transcriptional regulator, partial [Alcaligenes faecalis]|nr:LysR family transcriptional regulator [Alcaligenes faecalis]
MFLIDEKITVRRLEVLLAFLEAGTIARAAEQLGTSAVSVHRALKSLEEGLRCPLFLQEGRNLVPQESARELAEAAKETIRTLQHGIDAAREAGGYSSDQLRIGSMYSLTIRLVPRLLVELKVHKPLLQIDLVLDSNEKLLQKLRGGHIDAALIELP